MAGVSAAGWAGSAVLVLGLVALLPPAVRAEDVTASLTLPGSTIAAATVDVDRDGDRELVRLVDRDDGQVDAEAWQFDGARWAVTHGGQLTAGLSGPERSLALVPWTHDGVERLLVASSRSVAGFGDACCLQLAELRADRSHLTLLELGAPDRSGVVVQAFDLDGDGTGELVIQSQASSEESGFDGTATNEILRLVGDQFEPIWARGDPNGGSQVIVVDSDGRPGRELLVGPAAGGDLHRVSWRHGAVHVEDSHSAVSSGFGLVVGAAHGVIALITEEGLQTVRWPADARPSRIGRPHQPATPWATVVAHGDTAVVLTIDGLFGAGGAIGAPQAVAYDLELNEIGRARFPAETMGLLEFLSDPAQQPILYGDRSVSPYIGALPGAFDGRPAMAAAGALIQLDGDGALVTRPMSPMLGVWPIGRLGPDDGWMVLAHGYPAYGPGVGRFGPQSAGGPTTLVPIGELLDPVPSTIAVHLSGAAEIGRDGPDVSLLASADGFSAEVAAPDGSLVVFSARGASQAVAVEHGRASFEVRGRRNRGAATSEEFDRTVMVIHPQGAAALERWRGRFVDGPPALTTSARTDVLALSSTVTGRASNGAAVIVDGTSATLTPYGGFRATVAAPPWPRTVVITARDPLGNETTTTVEVIGLVDYRGLPWALIFATATVAAGAFLYLRTPRQRGTAAAPDGGEGTFEEIDGGD